MVMVFSCTPATTANVPKNIFISDLSGCYRSNFVIRWTILAVGLEVWTLKHALIVADVKR